MRLPTRIFVVTLSVLIPGFIAFLIFSPVHGTENTPSWILTLPHLNGVINTITTVILIFGYIFIKKGYREYHKTAMVSALALGIIFLVSYIIYHWHVPSRIFGDINNDGILDDGEAIMVQMSRKVYISLLLGHILLAAIAVPLILTTFYFALSGKFEKHKKIVRFALPVWLIVSISGVIVYLMISPYY